MPRLQGLGRSGSTDRLLNLPFGNEMANQTFAVTHLLGMAGMSMKAADFNKAAHVAGVLEKAFRASGKDPSKVKPFWKVGPAGEAFAVAIESDRSPEPIVQFHENKFEALLDFLRPTIEAMVREGELKPITRDAAKGAQYRADFEAAQHTAAERGEQF